MRHVQIHAAGSNAHGQLGNGSEDDSKVFGQCVFPADIDDLDPVLEVTSVATGANHTLILLRRASGKTEVWGSGDGRRGQLGADYQQAFGTSSIFHRIQLDQYEQWQKKFVCACWETSFVVVSIPGEGDIILSMGANDFGDLGVGNNEVVPNEQGFLHRVSFAQLVGASKIIVLIIKAGNHSILTKFALEGLDGQEFFAGWGAARHGQLFANISQKQTPSFLPYPSSISVKDVSNFAVGAQHAAYVHSSGGISAFGSNRKGQLRNLPSLKHTFSIGATWNGTYVVKGTPKGNDWSIYATGSNTHGQLAISPPAAEGTNQHVEFSENVSAYDFLALACGSEHVLLLLENRNMSRSRREVWGWGWNEHGNLGLNHTDDIFQPEKLWPRGANEDAGREVLHVWGGCGTSWIVTESAQE